MANTTWETIRPAAKMDLDEVEAAALAAATEVSISAVSHLLATADMTSAVWNTVGSHEVFTITGAVRLRMWVICTDTLADAANLATIKLGLEGEDNYFIALTNAAGKGGLAIDAGEFWRAPVNNYSRETFSNILFDTAIGFGQDVGYTIGGEALTGGVLEFHCTWEAMSADGHVAVGNGASL